MRLLGPVPQPANTPVEEVRCNALQENGSIGDPCGQAGGVRTGRRNDNRNGTGALEPRDAAPHAVLELDAVPAQERFQAEDEPFQFRWLGAAMPIVRNELKPVPTPASTRPGNISSRVAIALAVTLTDACEVG